MAAHKKVMKVFDETEAAAARAAHGSGAPCWHREGGKPTNHYGAEEN